MKIYFVSNICPHYRVKAFEGLAGIQDVRFFFFSRPENEKYWEKNNPASLGRFRGEYLRGWNIFGRNGRIVPGLYRHLLFDEYDVLIKCISGKLPLLLSFLIAKARRKPFILWTGLWNHPNTLVHRLSFPLVLCIYRHSDAIAVYGTHVGDYLASFNVPKEKVFYAWQAVDNDAAGQEAKDEAVKKSREELEVGDRRVVLYVGRMEKQKGLGYLAEALPLVNKQMPILFVGIGTGSETKEIASLLESNGFRDFRFVGYVPNDRLHVYYRMADVLVLPSITTRDFKEPWGLVVNEAMNQGCPVVATDSVGAAVGGLVKDGTTGLVVPERDATALERAIVSILKEPGLRESMSVAARAEVKQWTYERMVSGFDRAIKYVWEQKK